MTGGRGAGNGCEWDGDVLVDAGHGEFTRMVGTLVVVVSCKAAPKRQQRVPTP